MKILYGVVGEGMGHAMRSRVILEHLVAQNHDVEIMASGRAVDFLAKPLDLHDLRRVLARVFDDRRVRERKRVSAEEEASGYRLDSLVGHDPRMIETYKETEDRAARTIGGSG